jgi:hypothetical protein
MNHYYAPDGGYWLWPIFSLATVAIFCAWNAYDANRKLAASRALCDAQRSALMLEMEDRAKLQGHFDTLARCAANIADGNERMRAELAPLVIVPPAGGMVA